MWSRHQSSNNPCCCWEIAMLPYELWYDKIEKNPRVRLHMLLFSNIQVVFSRIFYNIKRDKGGCFFWGRGRVSRMNEWMNASLFQFCFWDCLWHIFSHYQHYWKNSDNVWSQPKEPSILFDYLANVINMPMPWWIGYYKQRPPSLNCVVQKREHLVTGRYVLDHSILFCMLVNLTVGNLFVFILRWYISAIVHA